MGQVHIGVPRRRYGQSVISTVSSVLVYLIRHAHAGSRTQWRGEDDQRPLSAKGRRQAAHLAERLKGEPIRRILSSPSRRCIETVEVLGSRIGAPVEIDENLSEGSDPAQAVRLLFEAAPDHPAISTHGDIVPAVIRRLVSLGMRTEDADISQKGSMWVIEIDGGKPVNGTYEPPC